MIIDCDLYVALIVTEELPWIWQNLNRWPAIIWINDKPEFVSI